MNIRWITDVTSPGNFPDGGLWFVELSPGGQKIGPGYFKTKEEAENCMQDEINALATGTDLCKNRFNNTPNFSGNPFIPKE